MKGIQHTEPQAKNTLVLIPHHKQDGEKKASRHELGTHRHVQQTHTSHTRTQHTHSMYPHNTSHTPAVSHLTHLLCHITHTCCFTSHTRTQHTHSMYPHSTSHTCCVTSHTPAVSGSSATPVPKLASLVPSVRQLSRPLSGDTSTTQQPPPTASTGGHLPPVAPPLSAHSFRGRAPSRALHNKSLLGTAAAPESCVLPPPQPCCCCCCCCCCCRRELLLHPACDASAPAAPPLPSGMSTRLTHWCSAMLPSLKPTIHCTAHGGDCTAHEGGCSCDE